jgi:hypothetical protein
VGQGAADASGRRLGLVLHALVGLAFVASALTTSPWTPAAHAGALLRAHRGVSPGARARARGLRRQGGLFLASGALLFLAAIPIRRGERWALVAAAWIVVCGNAGIILSTTQIGAGHLPMDVLMGMGLVGCGLCWRVPKAA